MKKYLLFGLLIAVFAVSGCGRKEPPNLKKEKIKKEDNKNQDPASMGDGVSHKVLSFNLEGMTEKGEKKWEVIGRTARSISENEIKLGDIVAKTYGDEDAVIVADEGIYNKSKNNVRLEKNVKATIENAGLALKDQIGFSVDPKESSKQETGSVTEDKEKKKKKMTITCDGEVEFDYGKNLAYFNKNVKVRSDDGDIDADKITVNLNRDTKKVNDIVAEGHVKITQKENAAYGDSAKYNEADKKVSLKGNPKVVISQEDGSILKEDLTRK